LQRYHKSHNEQILQDKSQLLFSSDSRLQGMLIRPPSLNFGQTQPLHRPFGRPAGRRFSKAAHEFKKVNYSIKKQGVTGESTVTAYFWIGVTTTNTTGDLNTGVLGPSTTLRVRLHSVLVHNTGSVVEKVRKKGKGNRSNRRNVSDLAVIMNIKL